MNAATKQFTLLAHDFYRPGEHHTFNYGEAEVHMAFDTPHNIAQRKDQDQILKLEVGQTYDDEHGDTWTRIS